MRKAFVEIIVGTLGGFKSYTAVRDYIIPWLRDGADVYTNIQVKFEALSDYIGRKYGVQIERDQLTYVTKKGINQGGYKCDCTLFESDKGMMGFSEVLRRGTDNHPNLLVWDEGHLDMDSAGYRNVTDEKKALYEFITQARKLDVHTVFITQNELNLDTRIRRMCTFYVGCKDGKEVKFLGLPFFAGGYFKVRWDPKNKGSGKKSEYKQRDNGIYKCYNSKALFSDYDYASTPARQLSKWRKPVRPKPRFKALRIIKLWRKRHMWRFYVAITCVVLGGLSAAMWTLKKVLSGSFLGGKQQTEQVAQVDTATQPQSSGPSRPRQPVAPQIRHYVSMTYMDIQGRAHVSVLLDDGRRVSGADPDLVVTRHHQVFYQGVRYYAPEDTPKDEKEPMSLGSIMSGGVAQVTAGSQ